MNEISKIISKTNIFVVDKIYIMLEILQQNNETKNQWKKFNLKSKIK